MRPRLPGPTVTTAVAGALTLASITGTAAFLFGRYELLPPRIPVHWRSGRPDLFMPKTVGAVFMPVWTQLILATVIGMVAILLLYRADKGSSTLAGSTASADDHWVQDRDRMLHGAEAISLLGLIWITFQGLTAWGVTELWMNQVGGMGAVYTIGLVTGAVLSIVVGARAALKIGRPKARHVDDGAMWRLNALYFNPADPALFVPARFGYGLTLNFGRPVAIALMLGILIVGLGGPLLLARLLLR